MQTWGWGLLETSAKIYNQRINRLCGCIKVNAGIIAHRKWIDYVTTWRSRWDVWNRFARLVKAPAKRRRVKRGSR